jgi:esterase/lipase superfamily enzyme
MKKGGSREWAHEEPTAVGGARIFSARLILAIVAAISLSGCAPGPAAGLSPSSEIAPGATEHQVLVATTRARDQEAGAFFNGERSDTLNYAAMTVSVPASHVAGNIEWPATPPGNPNNAFVVRSVEYLGGDADFLRELNAELARRKPGDRKVLLFIHGYNTPFSESLYRLTQLDEDANAFAVPVLFSWASRGHLVDYIYDSNSATIARDQLAHTLQLLFASNAEHIDILAHSMGNWVTVEALRQLSIAGRLSAHDKVDLIFLAAPDIDLDVFKSQLRQFKEPRKPFYVIVSRDDLALGFSSFIAGNKPRLGSDPNTADLTALGATVIDMTDVGSSDPANHGKYAQLAKIAPQLTRVLARGIDKNRTAASAAPTGGAVGRGGSGSSSLEVMNSQISIDRPH